MGDKLSVVNPNLAYANIDYSITRNRDVEGAFGTRLDDKKGTDNYYSVLCYNSTGYVSLKYNLFGLDYFRRPENPQDEEPKETKIEKALRVEARAFLNFIFSARKSITTTKKYAETFTVTYHFLRDDDNFPTAQEVRIAKDQLKEKLQNTVNLWLKENNPQKPV